MKILNDEYLDEVTQPIVENAIKENNEINEVIAERIKKIGLLTAITYNTKQMFDLNKISKIQKKYNKLNKNLVDSMYEELTAENIYFSENLQSKTTKTLNTKLLYNKSENLKKDMIKRYDDIVKSSGIRFNDKMQTIDNAYKRVVNKAIYETTSGVLDYNTAMRSSINELSSSGIRYVDFESGYSRRLDSQLRMNLLDGARQVNMELQSEIGKQLGADGVEISAHGMCAKDHIKIQGKQYTNKEFETLNKSLLRPIGTMNCHHFTFPIIIGVSEQNITNEELEKINKDSNKIVNWNGNDITKYEATQKMRQTETQIRHLREKRNFFKQAGNDLEVKRLNKKINDKLNFYKYNCDKVGLRPRIDKTQTFV